MTTNNTIFTSKEHYLAFRAAWANSVNSEKKHSITGAHTIAYNLLRNRDYSKGFTPITRTTKLQNGFLINQGLYWAMKELERMKVDANKVAKNDATKWTEERVESFLSVFEGTVSVEMLANLELPECKPMNADYGMYKKVAEHIMGRNGEAGVQISFEHVNNIHKMLTEELEAA